MAPTGDAPVPADPPAQNRARGGANARGRGRGGDRGRGRGRGRASQASRPRGGNLSASGPVPEDGAPVAPAQPTMNAAVISPAAPATATATTTNDDGEDVEAEVCFICASPVIHQSVAPCNHRTCHICALRMRALYKNKECAHCRTAAQFVLFSDDAAKRYEDYSDRDVTSTDVNIGIRYTNEDIVGDTVLLLRYNCPDTSCDFAGLGWPDLHRHVRATHNKKMCDLCTRNKKVFTHEHELFADKELEKHMRHGDDRPGAVDQTGFKGHPLCGFCGSRFYDGDKLYEHCRNKHERCFLCDRQDPRQPHYYRDYNALEDHFNQDHFLCSDRECLEKKFVVFASELDLKAHQLSEHADSLSKDVRRDARLVDLSAFDVRERYEDRRRGGGSGPSRDRDRRERDQEGRGGRGNGRGRDPNAEPLPASTAQPLRRDELALQRQMAIHSSQSVSNRTFGGQLSSNTAGPSAAAPSARPSSNNNSQASNAKSSTPALSPAEDLAGLSLSDPNLSPENRAQLMRHSAVVERASNLLHNDKTKIDRFRALVSSFRQDQTTAPAMIDALFTLFAEVSSSALGTLLREVADLFEDKTKGDRLRKAWNDWRAINEDYPTLPGLGGMRGATTSSSGWASAAAASPVNNNTQATAPNQRHTTRVLKLKNSTQQSRRSSVDRPGAIFAPVLSSRQATSAPSAAFPSLPPPSGASSTSRPAGASSGASSGWGSGPSIVRNSPTPAASSRSFAHPTGGGNSSSGTGGSGRSGGGGRGQDAFPALPAAPKPTTTIFGYGGGRGVRRDVGGGRSTGFSWGGASNEGGGSSTALGGGDRDAEGDANGEVSGKGKKGKGRKKVLVAWG
ncbi:hypothetical protein F4808DRAFT_445585 [Astrocystis sublimbata]|nr:hypothetical protein F4808DRAFT_445585 [Astrocystis sublimbata]